MAESMQAGQSNGFQALQVIAKVRESDTITSFHLRPQDASGWRNFEAGQFLVFQIPNPLGDEGPYHHIVRNYSVSSSPNEVGSYRITVKREASNQAGVAHGLGSSYLHDHVQVGDVLMADGPRGQFVLNCNSSRPVVFLSGGVGLTPLVSMLHAVASQGDRRAVFVHACKHGSVHALGDEVRSLAASCNQVSLHFVYRHPTAADIVAARHHSDGLITREMLQAHFPLAECDFYLCGPPAFMKSMYTLVRSLGVAEDRIAYEFFGPATVLAEANTTENGFAVTFQKSGLGATWTPSAHSLLAFAEGLGLSPEFSCRAGVCGTCRTGLLQGKVSYFEEPLDEVGDQHVLLCCARPVGPLVLDL